MAPRFAYRSHRNQNDVRLIVHMYVTKPKSYVRAVDIRWNRFQCPVSSALFLVPRFQFSVHGIENKQAYTISEFVLRIVRA